MSNVTEHSKTPGGGFRSSALARSPGKVLVIGAVLSVVLHGVLAVWLMGKPMGRISPEALGTSQRVVRIKRASYDRFVTEGEGASGGDEQEQTEPSSAEITQRILDDAEAELDQAQVKPELDMRQPKEPAPQLSQAAQDVSLEAYELPEQMLRVKPTRAPQALTYQPGTPSPSDLEATQAADQSRNQAHSALAAALGKALPGTQPVTAMDGNGPTVRADGGGGGGGSNGGGGERSTNGVAQRLSGAEAVVSLPGSGSIAEMVSRPQTEPGIDFTALAEERQTGAMASVEPKALDDDFRYQLSRFARGGDAGWFGVSITPRRSLAQLQTMAKDVVFVVDTSSSVPQPWVEQAIRGVRQSLPSLNDGDRFNIVLFDDHPRALSPDGIKSVSQQSLNEARDFLKNTKSRGWTDVNAALRRLLVRDLDTKRVYNIILISDGRPTRGVLDTRELLNLITRDNNLTAGIYCVGIGPKPNRELLNFLAYRNKGRAVYASSKDQAAGAVRDLLSRLRYPLIKDVHLNVAGLKPKNNRQVYPTALPSIHQGERFSVFGRYDPSVGKPRFTMRISGNSAGVPVDFTFAGDLTDAAIAERSLARDWAFWKLHHLYTRILREGKRPEILTQIDRLRRRYNLKTLY